MADDTVYRKTDRGRVEVETRSLGLTPRLRRVLILVNGTRPLADIAASLGGEDAGRIARELVRHGLIEADALPSRPAPASGVVSIEQIKALLAERIFADLGADGGNLIMQLGECNSRRQVLSHMVYVRNYYEKSVSAEQAETLWSQAQVLLDQDTGPDSPPAGRGPSGAR